MFIIIHNNYIYILFKYYAKIEYKYSNSKGYRGMIGYQNGFKNKAKKCPFTCTHTRYIIFFIPSIEDILI